jgi:hypothetical protein
MLLAVEVYAEVVNSSWFLAFHALQPIQSAYNLRLEMVTCSAFRTRQHRIDLLAIHVFFPRKTTTSVVTCNFP